MPALDNSLTLSLLQGKPRGRSAAGGFPCCIWRRHRVAESHLHDHPKASRWVAMLATTHKDHHPPISYPACSRRRGPSRRTPAPLLAQVSVLSIWAICQFMDLVHSILKKKQSEKFFCPKVLNGTPCFQLLTLFNKVTMAGWILQEARYVLRKHLSCWWESHYTKKMYSLWRLFCESLRSWPLAGCW